tara:strand:- start:2037 stop:2633 length:597 start_codon:yes stop_codon:yes gene_type:complete
MQNKFHIFFFYLLSNLAYAKCDLGSESLNKFFDSKLSLSSDFIQSFVNDDKDPIEGSILLQRPNNLKITLKSPMNSEILIDKNFVFQTDFDLDQTVRYDRNQMIDQIPAAILLLSSERVCKSFQIDTCSNEKCLLINKNNKLELVFFDEILKSLSFYSPNFDESKINFENLSIMQKINDSAFSYNQQVTDLLIFDRND